MLWACLNNTAHITVVAAAIIASKELAWLDQTMAWACSICLWIGRCHYADRSLCGIPGWLTMRYLWHLPVRARYTITKCRWLAEPRALLLNALVTWRLIITITECLFPRFFHSASYLLWISATYYQFFAVYIYFTTFLHCVWIFLLELASHHMLSLASAKLASLVR